MNWPVLRKVSHELQPPRTIQRVLSEKDTAGLVARLQAAPPQRLVLVLSHTHFSDPEMLTRQAVEREMTLEKETPFHLVDVLEFTR